MGVSTDLHEIQQLSKGLTTQAVHKANDPTYLPGGDALAALAPVASPEAWTHQYETAEELGRSVDHVLDEDDNDEPPLQTLLFWSERWRTRLGRETDDRASLSSEVEFLLSALQWAMNNEPWFKRFVHDVSAVRTRLENLLYAGERVERGVQCFDCRVDLVREARDLHVVQFCEGQDGVCVIPHRYCPHDRGGLSDEWVCPQCDRRYDVESYRRAVSHAHFLFAEFLPLREAMERTGAARGSIQGWASKGSVAKKTDPQTGRVLYRITDIQHMQS